MRRPWLLSLALVLLAIAALIYFADYLLFHDLYHLEVYFIGDLAFVFVEVLLVAVILQQLLDAQERKARLGKMNNVIGVFFSELGLEMLSLFQGVDRGGQGSDPALLARKDWTDKDFTAAEKVLASKKFELAPRPEDLARMKELLGDKRDFLLRLMENPNLLEHDRFTDMLLALFHLNEELERRGDFNALPKSDLAHLAGDSTRVYGPLITEWLEYMRHLRARYPYLYSLAVRTNPLDPQADPVVWG